MAIVMFDKGRVLIIQGIFKLLEVYLIGTYSLGAGVTFDNSKLIMFDNWKVSFFRKKIVSIQPNLTCPNLTCPNLT
jgi:hypothetical protein